MVNFIIVLVLILILGLSVAKIVSEKKKGHKCVGCPYSGNKNGGCNC
jgi:hypothetical protein